VPFGRFVNGIAQRQQARSKIVDESFAEVYRAQRNSDVKTKSGNASSIAEDPAFDRDTGEMWERFVFQPNCPPASERALYALKPLHQTKAKPLTSRL